MGAFDNVWTECPKCREIIYFKSKDNDCKSQDDNKDIIEQTEICEKCNTAITIHGGFTMWFTYKMGD